MLLATTGVQAGVYGTLVDGATGAEYNSIPVSTAINLKVMIDNDVGDTVIDVSNGFRIYSPNGIAWQLPSFDVGPDLATYLDFSIFTVIGVDGTNDDSIAIHAFAVASPGVPDGITGLELFWINTRLGSEAVGDTMCIDSSFYQPSGVWQWEIAWTETVIPSWGGPYCWAIVGDTCYAIFGDDGRLEVYGSPDADTVTLRLNPTGDSIEIDYQVIPGYPDYTFQFAQVDSIYITTGESDDWVAFRHDNGPLADLRPLYVDMGEGTNTFIGGDNVAITNLGKANLTIVDTTLVVSNCGSSGQDGAHAEADGKDGDWSLVEIVIENPDPSDSLPVGASLKAAFSNHRIDFPPPEPIDPFGMAISMTKAAASWDLAVESDGSLYSIAAYRNDALVFQCRLRARHQPRLYCGGI